MKATKLMLLSGALLCAGGMTTFADDETENSKGRSRGERRKLERSEEGQGRGKRSEMRRGKGRKIGGLLNLTEEQRAAMKELREKNRDKVKESRKALREAQKAFHEAAGAENVDSDKLRVLSKALAEKMADAAILRAEGRKEMRALLTEEQRSKLDENKAEMKERMQQRRQKREKSRKRRSEKQNNDD